MQKSRTRKLLAIVLTLAMVMSMLLGLGVTASAAWGGSGTQADPYTIANASDLTDLANGVQGGNTYSGKYFKLTHSFTVASGWAGIGTPSVTANATTSSPVVSGYGFAGTFDGNHQTLTVARSVYNTSGVGGVFNYVTREGVVKNLEVGGSLTITISGTNYLDAIGGIVGYNSGTLDNLTNNVNVSAPGAFNVGGIAGFNNGQYHVNALGAASAVPIGVIVNSINSGTVAGRQKVGGITGQNSGSIAFCANLASGAISTALTSGGIGVGGIAGRNGNNNTAAEMGWIYDCYNMGTINLNGARWGGGITGFNNALSRVGNCYNTGTVINGYQYWNAIIGLNENFNADQTTLVNYCKTVFSSNGTAIETGTYYANMQTDAFRGVLETATTQAGQWAWDGTGNSGYPFFLRTANSNITHGIVSPNSYPVVYLSNAGVDTASGASTTHPVKTLSRALTIASMSDDPNVYISVMNTNVITGPQRAFGTKLVKWEPYNGATSPMFQVNSGGSLIVGGVSIDGEGIATAVQVNGSGTFAIRDSASITDCTTAINVANNGNLIVNQSTIGGTTSIYLASTTSSCTLNAAPGQTISISGTISLGGVNTATYARLKIGSAVTGNLKISTTATASAGRIVAQVDGAYAAFTSTDLGKFTYVGTGTHGFTLASNNTQIHLT